MPNPLAAVLGGAAVRRAVAEIAKAVAVDLVVDAIKASVAKADAALDRGAKEIEAYFKRLDEEIRRRQTPFEFSEDMLASLNAGETAIQTIQKSQTRRTPGTSKRRPAGIQTAIGAAASVSRLNRIAMAPAWPEGLAVNRQDVLDLAFDAPTGPLPGFPEAWRMNLPPDPAPPPTASQRIQS
jgi:hypothetical protein